MKLPYTISFSYEGLTFRPKDGIPSHKALKLAISYFCEQLKVTAIDITKLEQRTYYEA